MSCKNILLYLTFFLWQIYKYMIRNHILVQFYTVFQLKNIFYKSQIFHYICEDLCTAYFLNFSLYSPHSCCVCVQARCPWWTWWLKPGDRGSMSPGLYPTPQTASWDSTYVLHTFIHCCIVIDSL